MFQTKGTLTESDREWMLRASASELRNRLMRDRRFVERDKTSWRLEQKIGTNWNLIVRFGLCTFVRNLFRHHVYHPIRTWWWAPKVRSVIEQLNRYNPPPTEFVKSNITIKDGHAVLVTDALDREAADDHGHPLPVIE